MKKLPKKITREALLALPRRYWETPSEYDSLYIVPTRKKHDSGYMMMAIVGIRKGKGEVAAWCDDICWGFPKSHPYGKMKPNRNPHILRTDCIFPSGIIHMWASGEHYFQGVFRVGASLSSTNVELYVVPRGDGMNTATGEKIMPPEPLSQTL